MLAILRMSNFKPVVAALYAVAMLMLGFAHMPVVAPAGASGQVAAALPNGTPITICGHAPDAPSGKHLAKHCDACCLMAASGLISVTAITRGSSRAFGQTAASSRAFFSRQDGGA